MLDMEAKGKAARGRCEAASRSGRRRSGKPLEEVNAQRAPTKQTSKQEAPPERLEICNRPRQTPS